MSAVSNAVSTVCPQNLGWFGHRVEGGPIRVPPLRRIQALNHPPLQVQVVVLPYLPPDSPSSVVRSPKTR